MKRSQRHTIVGMRLAGAVLVAATLCHSACLGAPPTLDTDDGLSGTEDVGPTDLGGSGDSESTADVDLPIDDAGGRDLQSDEDAADCSALFRATVVRPVTLTDVPALDPVSVPVVASVGGLAVALEGGNVVWFEDSTGTPLPFEVVSLQNSDLEAWVEWPLQNTEIAMWVGPEARRPATPPMWEGYAGVWHLGEGGAPDSSTHGNDGALPGGATRARAMFGSGLVLDGATQYVEIPDADSLRIDEFTISAWVRIGDLSQNTMLVAKPYTSSTPWLRSYGLAVAATGSLSGFGTPDGATTYSTFSNPAQTPPYTEGEWAHVVFARDRTSGAHLYLNGSAVHKQAFIQELAFDGGPLLFGAWNDGGGPAQLLHGMIDEVSIDSRFRSAAWIGAAYRAQVDLATVETLNEVDGSCP